MQLRAAHLCDYAEVREGLLTIVSAGITRLWPTELPGPMAIFIALQIELDAAERTLPHEIRVVVTSPSGVEVAQINGGLQIQPNANVQYDADEGALVSIPLDLRRAGVAEFGWHSIAISVDDQLLDTMRLKVARPTQPQQAAGRIPLRQPRRPH